jgi:predicted DNA-binding transcriptional regulator AlpA
MSQFIPTNPVSVSGNRTDTAGLDPIFDVTVSSDSADTSHNKTIEVSISEAAQRLGTSERTIWRRIDRGELKSKTKGNKRIVKLPVFTPTTVIDSDSHMTLSDTPNKASALIDLRALLKDLQAANYRIGYLESQLETHKEQVKLLPDLQSKATEADQLKQRLAKTEEELQTLKRTWWYRVWKRIKG